MNEDEVYSFEKNNNKQQHKTYYIRNRSKSNHIIWEECVGVKPAEIYIKTDGNNVMY